MKTRAIKVAAVSVMSLGLTAGLFSSVGAQSYNWQPQKPSQGAQTEISVENEVDLGLRNHTSQNAVTGDVNINDGDQKVSLKWDRHHDRRDNKGAVVGDVTTGTASNENSTSAKVTVSNTTDVEAPAPAQAENSHHDRDKRPSQQQAASVEVEVENDTDVEICNSTEQNAVSGSVNISGAKTVGDVTTGDASNTNETEFNISVSSNSSVN